MICSYAIMKKLLRCRLSSAHVRFDLSHRGTRCQLFIYLLNYQTKQRYRWEMMKQELHQLTKYLDLPQMNYLSYPPVTNHNIVGPAMSNNRGVHAHSCIMGNLGKMARMSNYRNVWENQGFLKTDHGLLCTSDLVYRFFELVSYFFQRESIKYMNSGRNIWLWILLQIFYWISRPLALITHGATMSVNSTITNLSWAVIPPVKWWSGIPRLALRISRSVYQILFQWNLKTEFQSLVSFRIPWAVFRILKSGILDSTTKNSQIPETGFPIRAAN